MIENFVLYLTILIGVAGAVTAFVEGLKPVIKANVGDNQSVYEALMFVARCLVSAVGIVSLGGAALFRAALPESFSIVPDAGLVVISSLFVAGGADFLHAIRDYMYALRDGQRSENEVNEAIISK